jgi:hypothetical protein
MVQARRLLDLAIDFRLRTTLGYRKRIVNPHIVQYMLKCERDSDSEGRHGRWRVFSSKAAVTLQKSSVRVLGIVQLIAACEVSYWPWSRTASSYLLCSQQALQGRSSQSKASAV